MVIQDYFDKENLGAVDDFPIEIKRIALRKNEKLIKIGDTVKNLYFINSGIVEAGMGERENRRIIDFFFEGAISTAASSMLTQQPTNVYHKCLTNCVVQIIPYDQILNKSDTSIIVNKFFISFLKNQYLKRVKKEKDVLTKNVETLYLELLERNPDVMEQISVANIARYLNIHPNSLSRIRKRISEENH